MIERLRASRFRSLGKIDVTLGPLTVLVGQNGAGKSNVVDALVFLSDCMQLGLEGAVMKRTGIGAIRHAGSQGRPYDVTVDVEVRSERHAGSYAITLTGDSVDDYQVKRERAEVRSANGDVVRFVVERGKWLEGPSDVRPLVGPTSLALPLLAGDERFAPLAASLRSTVSYSIFPDKLREPHKYDPRRPMEKLGSNWVSILKDQDPASWKAELIDVLNKLTGDIVDIKFQSPAGFLVVEFRHDRNPESKGRKLWFDAGQESDGTLRVAGIMTALLQQPRPALIAIEEPELTVHPGALEMLYEYVREASGGGQVILTTHSPDLLDLVSADEVRVVTRSDDETTVSPLDPEQLSVVKRGLFSLGEVMRAEGLRPQQQELPFAQGS